MKGFYIDTPERVRYSVAVDDDGKVVAARIRVKAHDKRETWRKLKHPVTLARLQAIVDERAWCPACGSSGHSNHLQGAGGAD